MAENRYRVIGRRLPAVDGLEKVQGEAIYGTDVRLPGQLYGAILRSPHAHARLVHLDPTRAGQLPGVRLVAHGRNTPRTAFGLAKQDERFFALDEVCYAGDEVAAVVAVDKNTARAALELIEVEYEPLPAVLDPLAALQPDSPLAHLDLPSNLAHHIELERGDLELGFRQAEVIHEETYTLQHQYQAYLEPQVTAAWWRGDRLTVWAPHQSARQLSNAMLRAFNISLSKIRFLQTAVGGGFGGKNNMHLCPIVALLARMAGAPVLVELERDEDFIAGMPSVPMVIRLRMGAATDGRITAKDTYIVADNGAYTASALGVLETAATRTDPLYRMENLRFRGDLVYTNSLGTSAFRGFGSTQHHFALESMLDTLAEKLELDPLAIRLRNATQNGDLTVHGWQITSCGLSDTLTQAARRSGWQAKRGAQRSKARGVGIACGVNISGNAGGNPAGYGSSAQVRVHADGTVQVSTGEGDVGQGANTVFAQIAAEVLGVPVQKVMVDPLDTDESNYGTGAVGSHVTLVGGQAVRLAALAAQKKLIEAAASVWGCPPGEVQLLESKLVYLKQELAMEISEAATAYLNATGGSRVLGEGFFRVQGTTLLDQRRYGNPSLGYSFAANVAEVEVDRETGQVTVLRLTAVHDAGQVINPIGAEGQIEGALLQGLGFALSEEYLFKDGRVLNPDFTNYHVPTALDAPEMDVTFVPTHEPNGPYGAKSLSECAMLPVAPAIANAIYDATGVRFTRLPITPEEVLMRLKGRA